MKIVEDKKFLRTMSVPWEGTNKELNDLIHNMRVAMMEAKGVGISAIQIGVPVRVFLARTAHDEIFINPVIKRKSNIMISNWEGCLSCKDTHVRVKRSHSITLQYTNGIGEEREVTFTGEDSQVVQHELDHLNGFLIIDRGKAYTPNGSS